MKKTIFDKKFIGSFDWVLLLLVFAVSLCGVIIMYSLTGSGSGSYLYLRQARWLLYGLAGMTIVLLFDYRTIESFAYPLYIITIILLIMVHIYGKKISGARRWIDIGIITFQPSELAKFMVIIVLSKFFNSRREGGPYPLHALITPFIIVLIPFLIIAKQPDLGTAIILMLIFVSVCLVAGVEPRSLKILFVVGLIAAPLMWFLLKDYQRLRILTLINPEIDPLGAGYHIIQSKIAVGSGGLFGKGLLNGTQSRLNFLPERYTDFIFAVFAEEMGFVGIFILIGAYLTIVLKGVDIIYQAKDMSGGLMAAGAVGLLASHIIINIAMVMGIFPVVGIPLPFMSYGGSFMITSFLTIGLLLNIRMRRFDK
ncbi:MAG: rod shape-determining protein RodA [Nitrospinota bacterium]|nr:rod shape-determining protein RodA [Nitrospinota bacterium]